MQQTIWVLYDGAPAHSSHDVMHYLDSHFRSMGKTKQASHLASVITRFHSCQLLLVWPHSHPISLLLTSTSEAIWRSPFMPNEVTCGIRHGMPLKWLEWQYATCLMSFGPWVLRTAGHSNEITVEVGCFSIFCELLVTGQMPFCSQLIKPASTNTLFVYFPFVVLLVAIFC
jgi:hypothetical protein